MRILTLFTFLLTSFSCFEMNAQETNTIIEKKIEFDELLAKKREINALTSAKKNYKIQIFYGNSTEAKKELTSFCTFFPEYKVTILYSNPTYKVLAGQFTSRMEGKKALREIQKEFPNALLIEPNK